MLSYDAQPVHQQKGSSDAFRRNEIELSFQQHLDSFYIKSVFNANFLHLHFFSYIFNSIYLVSRFLKLVYNIF